MLKSYKEIIKDDVFKTEDEYFVDTKLFKLCWGCEMKHKSGHMVSDTAKIRRIFLRRLLREIEALSLLIALSIKR